MSREASYWKNVLLVCAGKLQTGQIRAVSMKDKYRIGLMLLALFAASIACSIPTSAQPTPTPTSSAGNGNLGITNGSSGSNNNIGSTQQATSSPSPSPSPSASPSPSPSPTPTPLVTPNPMFGPYVVKQIETLGGEVISGFVCDLRKPFTVNFTTPKVSFTVIFSPKEANTGGVVYKYSIPSAGESHDAAGNYTINTISTDGTLQLSFSVSDHVVFKGFDGNIPNRYKFNLVPDLTQTCP